MRRTLSIAGPALLVGWAAIAPAAGAQASSVNAAAERECRQERRFDRAEFVQDYRGAGAAALRRCIAEQKAEARRDCLEERREDRAEYRRDYGTGRAAFRRCMLDELR